MSSNSDNKNEKSEVSSSSSSSVKIPSTNPPTEHPEDLIQTIPDLEMAQLLFALSSKSFSEDQKKNARETILQKIVAKNMLPYYEVHREEYGLKLSEAEVEKMKETNEKKLKEFADKQEDAEKNQGENEIREAILMKAAYLSEIGDKEKAETAIRQTAEKTVSVGQKLDLVFLLIRLGFFWHDYPLLSRNIEKAKSLAEEGGDWERRNRLKVYEGLWWLSKRDFSRSAALFVDSLSTFASPELFSFHKLIFYAVISNILSVDRVSLKKNIVDSSDVLSVILEIPHLFDFLNSFYNSNYSLFFTALAETTARMDQDVYLHSHSRYFSREMRLRAYSQLLESYRSVQLLSMANQFGVTVDFLDQELSRFISAGRLTCKIDKVNGIVETNQPDSKSLLYSQTLKQGDLLLSRIQKLARITYL